jgi:carboxyl-terminal processing protease
VGYVRVASFPGAIGQQFARDLDVAIADLKKSGCDRLIFDVRGNVGGGLGSLRLMSYICPGKIPVGYSVTRAKLRNGYSRESLPAISAIPSSKIGLLAMAVRFRVFNKDRSLALVTEGLGQQPFHGRVVILQNEFTHSAAEMVTSFAVENGLATVVGTRSAGEVLGGANFTLPSGYRLRIPIAGWFTWSGASIEGSGVKPGVALNLAPHKLASGEDDQLRAAKMAVTRGDRL